VVGWSMTEADYFVTIRNYTLRQVHLYERFKFVDASKPSKHVLYTSHLHATFFDYGRPVHVQLPEKCLAM
jgi:hypothetical protein